MAKKKQNNRIHKPNPWIYTPLVWLCSLLTCFFYRLKIKRGQALQAYKGPLLVIGNHVSYVDPVLMAVALGSKWKVNFVAAGFVMSRPLVRYIFQQIGVIPTTQFVTTPSVTRSMIRLLREGACVAYYPEAERSNSGYGEAIDMSTAKFVKLMKVPLAFCRLEGAYLTWPRWAPSKLYRGRCFATIDIILSSEDVEALTVEEIHAHILKSFQTNDYDWQKSLTKPKHYRRKQTAMHLEKILYRCLKCNSNFTLTSSKNTLRCEHCNHVVEVEATGFLKEAINVGDQLITHPGEWYVWQKGLLNKELSAKQNAPYCVFKGSVAGHYLDETYDENNWDDKVAGTFELSSSGLTFTKTSSSEESEIFPFKDYLGLMLEHGVYVQFINTKRVQRCYFENPYAPSLIRQAWEIAVNH